MKKFLKPLRLLMALIVLICIIVLAKTNKDYSMMIINLSLIYMIATFGVFVMLGMGGQLSFATVSFMGAGAYFAANMCSGRLGFWMDSMLVLLLTIVLFAIISFLVGSVLFMLKGTYFTFATIGLVQVAWCFYQNYRPLFGGPDGISGIQPLTVFGKRMSSYNDWFYVLVFIVIVVAFLVNRIKQTQFGRSLASVRDNETAAKTLGVNVYMTKVFAFTVAGVLAALSGALYAMHGAFVSSDMFTFERATQFIIMAMLGGVNNVFGIITGSVLITLLPEWLRVMQGYLQLIYGVSIILLMVFMPMGLAGLVSDKLKNFRRKKNAAVENAEGATLK